VTKLRYSIRKFDFDGFGNLMLSSIDGCTGSSIGRREINGVLIQYQIPQSIVLVTFWVLIIPISFQVNSGMLLFQVFFSANISVLQLYTNALLFGWHKRAVSSVARIGR
jgi:hypothetical protein